LRGFDVATAWEAVRKQATLGRGNDLRPGNGEYLARGYIPQDAGEWIFGAVSTALEYALVDWTLARLGAALGKSDDAAALLRRSRAWERTLDRTLARQRPRKADGSWLAPFDPAATCCDKPWPESGGPGFVEGSAWQYTFFVPHDIDALIGALGASRFV